MASKKKTEYILNGIIIPDSGRFTAYFEEFPDVTAEGDTEEEVKNNLMIALKVVLKEKQKEASATTRKLRTKKHFNQKILVEA